MIKKVMNRYFINLLFFKIKVMKQNDNGKNKILIRFLSNQSAKRLTTFLSW